METSAKLFIKFVHIEYFPLWYETKAILSKFYRYLPYPKEDKTDIPPQAKTIIGWKTIRAIVEVVYTKSYNSTGRPSYDGFVQDRTFSCSA